MPLDRDHDTLERQAPLVVGDALVRGLDRPRVHERERLLLRVGPEDEDAAKDADLRRREAQAVRVVEQLLHSLDEARELLVEALDLVRLHPQGRIRVLADLGERDVAPGLRLGVELLVPDFTRVAHTVPS